MKPADIIEGIKLTHPAALKGVDDKVAARLLRLVFADIAEKVGEAEDGVVAIPGFGRFRVKTVELEQDGVKTSRKRITFLPAAKKAPTAAE